MELLARYNLSHIKYDRREQLWSILKRYSIRGIITAILLSGFIFVGKGFESMDTLDKNEKGYLNSANIALAVLLSMNITSAIGSFGQDLRWFILSRKSWHLPVAERILDYENLSSALWIVFHTTGRRIQMFSVFWIVMSVILQVLIAVLGIGFGLEEGVGILSPDGEIWVGDLTEFSSIPTRDDVSLFEQQKLAYLLSMKNEHHQYSPADESTIMEMESNLEQSVPRVLVDWDKSTNTVKFRNYDRNDFTVFLSTNRSVTATSNCDTFYVIEDDELPENEIIISVNDTETQIQLPTSSEGNAIYYMNPDDDCGPRCAQISVYRPGYSESYFFNCTVEVGEVENAKRDFEKIPDTVAKIAAGVAVISGEYHENDKIQYARYADKLIVGDAVLGNKSELQNALSTQAVNSLLGLSEMLPGVNTTGEQPFLGSSMDIQWTLIISIVSAIGAVQLMLALCVAFFASKVVVYDPSAISLTLLLEDVLDDAKLKGINILARSNGRKNHNRSDEQYYRYGFMKARAESEIDYSLTLKATDQPIQGDFPPGCYGKESPHPIFEELKGYHGGSRYESSQESLSLLERAVDQPRFTVTL